MASITPQLVPRDQLQQANALMSLVRAASRSSVPRWPRCWSSPWGPGWALMADAVTWLVAAAMLLGVHIPARKPKPADAPGSLADLREGWTFFRATTWLWVVVLAFGFLNAIHVGALFTLGPVVAKDTIGVQGWGLVLSAEAVGLLAMTLVLLRVRLAGRCSTGCWASRCWGCRWSCSAPTPSLGLLVVVMFVAGAGQEVFGIGWNLAMQENIDEEMLSRAYSYDALGSWVAMPIGQLAYGPLGAAFGYEEMLVVSGIAYVAICMLTLLSRSVRDLPRRQTAASRRVSPRPDLLLERGRDTDHSTYSIPSMTVGAPREREQPVAQPLGTPPLGHAELLLPGLLGRLARGAAAVGHLAARWARGIRSSCRAAGAGRGRRARRPCAATRWPGRRTRSGRCGGPGAGRRRRRRSGPWSRRWRPR